MDAQDAQRVFPQQLGWLHLLPRRRKAIEPATCRRRRARPERALTLETSDGRFAFDPCSPPCEHAGIRAIQRAHAARRALADDERHERRAVPEPQRPLLRSSRTAATMSPPGSGAGGGVSTISSSRPRRARRMTPARSSRARRPSSGPASPALTTGSRRATGRLRSVIRMDSPCRTRSSNALRRFFVSDIVALFIELL